MDNPRKYGNPPYNIVVVHGGPGAAGDMAPVARVLCAKQGVLEPLQTAHSVRSQTEELAGQISGSVEVPVTVIGHSWGAWLAAILAARHPQLVRKLILVSSGPFEEKYSLDIHVTRMNRLNPVDRDELEFLFRAIENKAARNRNEAMARIGKLLEKADVYSPAGDPPAAVNIDAGIFNSVWPEAAKMRQSGELLAICSHIKCPVTAIHGSYDPHPAAGVEEPLKRTVKDFRFVLLDKCGHYPWKEKEAAEKFYEVLEKELRDS